MINAKVWEYASWEPELREGVPMAFVDSLARNGGYYKVQAIDPNTGVIIWEAKSE